MLEFSVGEKVGFGERETTNWWSCKIWGKRAEGSIMDYLVKGAQVVVFGEATLRKHNDKIYPEINVTHIELVGSRQNQGQQQPQQQGGYGSNQQQQNNFDDGDGLPF